jgi:hypothetical protein
MDRQHKGDKEQDMALMPDLGAALDRSTDRDAAARLSELQFKRVAEAEPIQNRAKPGDSHVGEKQLETFAGDKEHVDYSAAEQKKHPLMLAWVRDVKTDGPLVKVTIAPDEPKARFHSPQRAHLVRTDGSFIPGGQDELTPNTSDGGKTATATFLLSLRSAKQVKKGDQVYVSEKFIMHLVPEDEQVPMPISISQKNEEGKPQIISLLKDNDVLKLLVRGGQREFKIMGGRIFFRDQQGRQVDEPIGRTAAGLDFTYFDVFFSGTFTTLINGGGNQQRAEAIIAAYQRGELTADLA